MSIEIPEIERTAVDILKRTTTFHLLLRAWVRAVCADPDYQEHLDAFPVDDVLRMACMRSGYTWTGSGLRTLADRILDHDAYDLVDRADAPRFAGTPYAETMTRLAAGLDDAVYRLCATLVFYRRLGRPTGDFPPEFQVLVGPLALRTTSLATAIVEFSDSLAQLVWTGRDGWYYRRDNG